MSFQNLTIGKKITLGFGLLFALLILVAAITLTTKSKARTKDHDAVPV